MGTARNDEARDTLAQDRSQKFGAEQIQIRDSLTDAARATTTQRSLRSDQSYNAEARAAQMANCRAEAVLTMTDHTSLIFDRSHALSLPATFGNH